MNLQIIVILALASFFVLGPLIYVFLNYMKHGKEYTKQIGLFWLFVVLHFILSAVVGEYGNTYLIGATFSFLVIPITMLTNIIFYNEKREQLNLGHWIAYEGAAVLVGTLLYLIVPDDLFSSLISTKFTLLTLPIVIVQSIPAYIVCRYLIRTHFQVRGEELYRVFLLIYFATNIPNSFFFCFGRLDPDAQQIGYTIAMLSFASGSLIVVAMNMMLTNLDESIREEKVKVLRASLLNNVAHDSREGILSMGEGAEYLIDKILSGEYERSLFLQTLEEIRAEAKRVSASMVKALMVKALENERKITMDHILEISPVTVEFYLGKIASKLRGLGIDPSESLSTLVSKDSFILTDRNLAYDSLIMNLVTNAIRHTSDLKSLRFRFYHEDQFIIFEAVNNGAISEDTIILGQRGLKPKGRLGLTNFFFVADSLKTRVELMARNEQTIGRVYFNQLRIAHSDISSEFDSHPHHS